MQKISLKNFIEPNDNCGERLHHYLFYPKNPAIFVHTVVLMLDRVLVVIASKQGWYSGEDYLALK
jgi:hypothetical protein